MASASSAKAPSNPGLASPPLPPKDEVGVVVASDARSAASTAPETALASGSSVDQTTLPADNSGSPSSPIQSSAQSPRISGLPLATPAGALVFSNVLGGAGAAPARPSEQHALSQTQPDLVQALQLVLDQLSDFSSRLTHLETRCAPPATIALHVQGGGDGVAQGGPPGGIFATGREAPPALPGVSGDSTPTPGAAVLVGHVSDATRDTADGAVSGSLFLPPHSLASGEVAASVPDPQSHGLARLGGLSTPFPKASSFLAGGQRPPASSATAATPETVQSSTSAHTGHQSISSSLVHASAVVATVPVPQLRDPTSGVVAKWLDQIESYVLQGVLPSLTPYLSERVKSVLLTRGYGLAGEPAFDSLPTFEQLQVMRRFLCSRDKLAERMAIKVPLKSVTTAAALREQIVTTIARLREWMTSFGGSEAEAVAQLMSSFPSTAKSLFEELAKNTYAGYLAHTRPDIAHPRITFDLAAASIAVSYPQFCSFTPGDQEAVWSALLSRAPTVAGDTGSGSAGAGAASNSRGGRASSGSGSFRGGAKGASHSFSDAQPAQQSQQRQQRPTIASLTPEQRDLLRQLEAQGAISVHSSRNSAATAAAPSPSAKRESAPSGAAESQRGGRGGHRGGHGGRGGRGGGVGQRGDHGATNASF